MVILTQEQLDISDVELLRRYITGQDEAFAILVRRYQKELYGFLRRFTGDAALAEDLFQETFLQVHLSAGMFDMTRSFRPWLYTIAVNKARDALRKRGRHLTLPLDAVIAGKGEGQRTYADLIPSKIPTPEESFVNLETRQTVQAMVEQMPENLRDVLILSYFQELPYKEIAEILSVPIGTVKSRMHNAVKFFAEKWKVWAEKTASP
ncbi:MAG TPA: sigma-70 family RNA polymerase sigma factor [Phycisphaerae bacterium]|nr:sigma-70 family RNA polymerase sigma factor [Phycisphaerae bacterium]